MALARIVCGNCGTSLSLNERECSQCGEQVEFAGSPSACPACGHSNVNSGSYCESCGARMKAEASGPAREAPANLPGKDQKPASASIRHRFEPWQIAAGVAMFLLLAYFGYSELDRPYPPPVVQQKPAPPRQSPVPTDELRRLGQLVAANPNDAGAVLQFANRLHDAGLSDPQYLPRAIDTYKQYLVLNPSDPNARVDLGICYFEIGKLDSSQSARYFGQAVEQMEIAFQAHPDHQPAAFNLGIVSLFMGDMEGSTNWFRKAVELNPESDLGKRAQNLLSQHSFQQPVN